MSTTAPSRAQAASGSPVTAFVACHVATLLGIAMVVAPFVFEGIERTIGDAAFAMVFVGAILALSAFFSSFVFLRRLRIFRELLREDRLLAHWRYDEGEWRSFADAEHATNRGTKRILVAVVAAFAVLYFGAAALFAPRVAGVMIVAGLAVVALLAAAAWLSTWLSQRRNRTRTGEARIGRRGLWINGALHTWSGGGVAFRECRLDEATAPGCLVFTYAAIERHGPQVHEARVPIPHDRLEEAKRVMASLNAASRIDLGLRAVLPWCHLPERPPWQRRH